MNDYNTQRPNLILKEYGRNIQKLVAFVRNTEDKEKRHEYAATLVDLMRQLNQNVRDDETSQKLWDDLFIMADFNADIDGPYPKPEREILIKKPQRLKYSAGQVKFKHFGRNIELLIKQAMLIEDPQEREDATIYLGRLMKGFNMVWNRENPDEQTIINNLKELSSGILEIDVNKVRENKLFDSNIRDLRDRTKEASRENSREGGRDNRDRNRGNNKNRNKNNQNRRRRN
jgi:hypothetical protein